MPSYNTRTIQSNISKLAKHLLILLPLARENVGSYLSPVLGLYSIKPSDFLNTFITQFNESTQFKYDDDFDDFLQDEVTFLSTTNLVIPVHVIITDPEKGKYNLFIQKPSFFNLLQLHRTIFFRDYNIFYSDTIYRSRFFIFMYQTFQLLNVQLNLQKYSPSIIYDYLQYRHLLVLRARSLNIIPKEKYLFRFYLRKFKKKRKNVFKYIIYTD